MHIRLEKISPSKNQFRFYTISVVLTLFGEWAVVREWGRIGSKGGQRQTQWRTSYKEALLELNEAKLAKERRGYEPRPQQLQLPF